MTKKISIDELIRKLKLYNSVGIKCKTVKEAKELFKHIKEKMPNGTTNKA